MYMDIAGAKSAIKNYGSNNGQPLVKNLRPKPRKDFSLAVLRFVVLLITALAIFAAASPLQKWPGDFTGMCAGIAVFAFMLAFVFSFRKTDEWERAIVLRFGKFKKIAGPGFFFILPLADRIAQIVDIRIKVSDFSAQQTLTGDSVTVDVDALCFWLIWDPQKAVLEVENYLDAVVLSSKTALRSAISSHDLSTFLERGDVIEKQIREEVDKKTTEWGITVLHIEITDIKIPEPLQDSLSKVAQAEREKQSRVLLAEAEIEIARKLEEAVKIYSHNDPALKLKILSILNEGLKAGNSMMLVPNSVAEELETRGIFGLAAINEIRKNNNIERKED
jgi:regulator of protease activity HflC (stomatin/prohibitin superfamily)